MHRLKSSKSFNNLNVSALLAKHSDLNARIHSKVPIIIRRTEMAQTQSKFIISTEIFNNSLHLRKRQKRNCSWQLESESLGFLQINDNTRDNMTNRRSKWYTAKSLHYSMPASMYMFVCLSADVHCFCVLLLLRFFRRQIFCQVFLYWLEQWCVPFSFVRLVKLPHGIPRNAVNCY